METAAPPSSTPSPSRTAGRTGRAVRIVIVVLLLAVIVQVGFAVRRYRANSELVRVLDKAKYGGGIRTSHSDGRVHEGLTILADTKYGPLPAIGEWLQETWWLLGEPTEIQTAGPGVPLEETLASVAGSPYLRQVGLFACGAVGDELRHLEDCVQLTTLYARRLQLRPDAFRHIAACESLTTLDLSKSIGVDDAAVAELAKLTRLEVLKLEGTAVTDTGLKQLVGRHPKFLDLSETAITDNSVTTLVEMSPDRLLLSGSSVTAEGVTRLRRSSPQSEVVWDANGP
ncbi:MAG: hypothetical protein H0T47_00905 [Planctomycetaceae bacterium]|nr:hypothetical protein [Planctomycetaceae bacterium]